MRSPGTDAILIYYQNKAFYLCNLLDDIDTACRVVHRTKYHNGGGYRCCKVHTSLW